LVAATLLRAAEEAGSLAARDVRWERRVMTGRRELTILVNEVNVSAPLLLAPQP
tara:strand:- start:508 stop:669 length:162 start_codon:yes stop_codon:yes gene_type:complete